jgi:methylmalonyl-CoA mutase
MQHASWNDFEPMNQARWRDLAEKGLRGRPWSDVQPERPDGWEVLVRVDPTDPAAQPVGLPERAIAPPGAGQPWQVQQTLDDPASLMQALQHGVQGVRISEAAQQAHGLDALLEGVYLDMVDVHLDGPEATGLLRDLVERQVPADALTGSCSRDVLRAADGERLARHVEAWGAAYPKLLTWGADAAPWLDAGASLVDALSAVLSGLDAGVAALEKEGIGFEQAVARCTVRWAVGSEVLVEVAALRALRRLWAQWLTHRHAAIRPLWIDARTSTRNFVRALPEDNLLRTTAATYASVLGGADGIETLPHDFREPHSTESARRYARNIQHLLREESSLHLTFDPMQGSHALEYLTNQVVERAWNQYVADVSEGGWSTLWEEGIWKERVLAGREQGRQAKLFLPRDIERGTEPMPVDLAAPVFYPDHEA